MDGGITESLLKTDETPEEKSMRQECVKQWFNEQRRMWVDTKTSGHPAELFVSKKLFRYLLLHAQENWDLLGQEISYPEALKRQGEDKPFLFRNIPIVSY